MVSTVANMPPGTQFTYLGRPAVVLRYADESEQAHSFEGRYGLVYEYVDAQGQIHKRDVAPGDYDAFRSAVCIAELTRGPGMVVLPEPPALDEDRTADLHDKWFKYFSRPSP